MEAIESAIELSVTVSFPDRYLPRIKGMVFTLDEGWGQPLLLRG